MNLEEMKKALASDATEKAKKQEEEIKRLKKELSKKDIRLKEKDKMLKEKDEMLRHMFNRCMAMTQGAMCIFCGYISSCSALQSIERRQHDGEVT